MKIISEIGLYNLLTKVCSSQFQTSCESNINQMGLHVKKKVRTLK